MPTAPSTTVKEPVGRVRRTVLYGLLGLISLFYLVIGGQKVVGSEAMVARMAELHYPAWATRLIGLIEVGAVVALWWRRSRTWALSFLILIMAGAAGSHLAYGHPPTQVATVFGIAGILGATLLLDRGPEIARFLKVAADRQRGADFTWSRDVARYALLSLLSAWFLFLGGQKLLAIEPMASNMAEIRFGGWPMHLIGLVEVGAVPALWWKPSRVGALVVLLPIVAGGAGGHLGAGQGMARASGAFLTAVLIGTTLFVDQGWDLWRFLTDDLESAHNENRLAAS